MCVLPSECFGEPAGSCPGKTKSKFSIIFEITTRTVYQLASVGTICRTVTTGKDLTLSCVPEGDASEKDDLTGGKSWPNYDVCNMIL